MLTVNDDPAPRAAFDPRPGADAAMCHRAIGPADCTRGLDGYYALRGNWGHRSGGGPPLVGLLQLAPGLPSGPCYADWLPSRGTVAQAHHRAGATGRYLPAGTNRSRARPVQLSLRSRDRLDGCGAGVRRCLSGFRCPAGPACHAGGLFPHSPWRSLSQRRVGRATDRGRNRGRDVGVVNSALSPVRIAHELVPPASLHNQSEQPLRAGVFSRRSQMNQARPPYGIGTLPAGH